MFSIDGMIYELSAGEPRLPLSDHLEVEHRQNAKDASLLAVSGELDIESAPVLDGALRAVEGGLRPARIVLDMSALTFIDSTGIGVLVAARRRADQAGRCVVLSNLQPQVERLLKLTGIIARFTVI